MPRMIFVYTGQLSEEPRSGSYVRPVKMLEAFKAIGFEVTQVVGYSRERREAIREVRSAVRRGERYDFCYVETTTMPIALGDPSHFPQRPFQEFRLISCLTENGIPVLLFYRDVYWNFPQYGKQLGFLKRNLAIAFYRYELNRIYNQVSQLYLPARRMSAYLPGCPESIVSELPPGCDNKCNANRKAHSNGKIELLYVGSVTPPNYDVSDMLDSVKNKDSWNLTIVCRKEEADYINALTIREKNVSIKHLSSKELATVYPEIDLVFVFNRPTEYLSFAMPVKLFEALGYGVPVLARSGTAAGDFVAREGVGWVASGPEEARALLLRLAEHPEEIEEMRYKVREAAVRHTWAERALKVARDAERIRAAKAFNNGSGNAVSVSE